jgi:uncharacterized caspase-like protein
MIVIGIDKFRDHKIDELKLCVNDAKAVAQYGKEFGYEIIAELYNEQASRAEIMKALLDSTSSLPESCRLFIFIATHGSDKGYLIPHDFDSNWPLSTSISYTDLGYPGFWSMLKPRHVFCAIDACFSAQVYQARAPSAPAQLISAVSRPSRTVLCAAQSDQYAYELKRPNEESHSVFTSKLLKSLRGEAFLPTQDWICATELGARMLQEFTLHNPDVEQTPKLLTMPMVGQVADGDYVFERVSIVRMCVCVCVCVCVSIVTQMCVAT